MPGKVDPVSVSLDGDGTKKYLFQFTGNRFVETVYLTDGKRHTLCVSSQAGCRMGCVFCNTGRNGFYGNLTAEEIVTQLYSIPERKIITHLVFMGMGEPLDNPDEVLRAVKIFTAEWGFSLSRRHITISTIGLSRELLVKVLKETGCNLAISLHFPFQAQRAQYMPAGKKFSAEETLALLREIKPGKKQRITIAYTLFDGLNDSDIHLDALVSLLGRTSLRVNLIPYNTVEFLPYRSSPAKKYRLFQKKLLEAGISTTIRKSRGASIDAACGLLSVNNKM